MRTSRKTDFHSRDIAKNNFSGIDMYVSQGLDLEPSSLSSYFLLVKLMPLSLPFVRTGRSDCPVRNGTVQL